MVITKEAKKPKEVAAPKDEVSAQIGNLKTAMAQMENRLAKLEGKMDSAARIFEDINLILTDPEVGDFLSIAEEK